MEREELMPLLLRVRGGDDEAFSLLARRFAGMTEGLVRAFTDAARESDVGELSQEARLALYRAACTYDNSPAVTFGLYARICVRNALISYRRRCAIPAGVSLCSIDSLLLPDEREPVGTLVEAERLAELTEAIGKILSSYEARVLALLIEGEKNAEIAKAVGKSEKSVGNAVFRIQSKLRKMLGN